MKRVKSNPAEESPARKVKKKLVFFLHVNLVEPGEYPWLKQVIDTVSRSPQDAELLLIHPTEILPEAVQKLSPSSANIKTVRAAANIPLSELIRSSAKGDYYVSLNGVRVNISQLMVSMNRTDFDAGVVVASELSSESAKGFLKNTGTGLYHWFTHWLTAVPYRYAHLSPFALKFTHLHLVDDIDFSKPLVSQHYDLVMKEPDVTPAFKIQPEKSALKGSMAGRIPALFALGIRKRINWFVREPLKERNFNLADPYAPIHRLIFFFLSVFILVLMCTLSFDYGITWDEKIQYDYAKDIFNYYASFGQDREVFNTNKHLYNTMLYYGSSFDLLTVIVNKLFGITEYEYETRHFLNAIFGFIGMFYTGLIAKYLAGNWRAAIFALLFIVLTPTFFGHSMNNPKDIPFGAAMIFSFYQLIRLIPALPNPGFTRISLLVIGIGAAISVRVGGLLTIAFLGLFMFISWMIQWRKGGFKTASGLLKPYFRVFLFTAVGGYLLGLVFWPYGLEDPFTHPYKALKGFSNVSYLITYELFDGVKTWMSHVPWSYTFMFMGFTIPVMVLFSFAASTIFLFFKSSSGQKASMLMLLFILFFPILYAIKQESMLYNGWRHFLFVYPVIVVLAAYFWENIIQLFKPKAVKYVLLVIFLLGNVRLMAWMVKNHPNQYVYFNELAGGIEGAYARFETDYYSNSLKQAAEWLCANENLDAKRSTIVTNNEPLTGGYYIDRCSDSAEVVWTREYELSKKFSEYALFTTRTMTSGQILNGFPPKGTIHTISVDGVPLCAVVKRDNQYIPTAYQLNEKGLYDSALYYIALYLQYDTTNEEAYRLAAMTYINKGGMYYDSCLVMAEKAIDLYPENFIAWDLKGLVYVNRQDYDLAEKTFMKSINFKVNYTSAHRNRGIALINAQRYNEAAEEFSNAIKYGGQQPEFYKLLGLAYLNMNNLENAIKYLGYSIQLNPNDASAYDYLGQAFEAKGDAASAAKYYEQAAKLGLR